MLGFGISFPDSCWDPDSHSLPIPGIWDLVPCSFVGFGMSFPAPSWFWGLTSLHLSQIWDLLPCPFLGSGISLVAPHWIWGLIPGFVVSFSDLGAHSLPFSWDWGSCTELGQVLSAHFGYGVLILGVDFGVLISGADFVVLVPGVLVVNFGC